MVCPDPLNRLAGPTPAPWWIRYLMSMRHLESSGRQPDATFGIIANHQLPPSPARIYKVFRGQISDCRWGISEFIVVGVLSSSSTMASTSFPPSPCSCFLPHRQASTAPAIGSLRPPGSSGLVLSSWRHASRRSLLSNERKFSRPERRTAAVCSAERAKTRIAGFAATEPLPERMKVVAMVSLAMCLCNADRVIMSVAVVPLAARHAWSSSFIGVVQVLLSSYFFFQLHFLHLSTYSDELDRPSSGRCGPDRRPTRRHIDLTWPRSNRN